ncbi:U4/U6.U5 tri-snRNP-associated protein 2 isoform X2 [Hemicordylus capensis]|uniref:U4/U6.U5 tri-snRNP-associated protein 2 isoform X2 n=1 Tax=Hemicordylus capensis TaxID=884348 RepID=UPI002302036F|nr:U4/U6.U5 tri-snRNP-associated protein 2 isoform X2 [Hemicordylus capensis]
MDRERQVSLGEVAHAPDPIRGLLTRRRGIQSPPSPSRPKAETSLSRLRQRCAPRVRRGVGRRSVSVEMSGGRVKRERDSRPPSSSSSRSSVASRIKQEPGEERGAATTRGSRGRAASAAAAAAAVPVRVKREPDEEPRIKREPDEEVEDDDDEEPTGVSWTSTLRSCARSRSRISMSTLVWCVGSISRYVLKPTFTKQHITNLDKQAKLSRAYDGTTYLPGIVGLNNIKANDYANAVLQALSNVPPLRNYFLEEENYKTIKRPPGDIMFLLVQRFGELMRKLWNPRNFKAHVSPHEMLQAVVLCSKKNFQITKQGDGVDFLSWFLNALHLALGGTKKKKKTIVTDVFQGSMRIFTKKLPHPDLPAEEKEQLLQNDEYQEKMVESTFMYLTLDLPTAPLYKDEKEQLIIPQVPLFNILAKFNGITEKEYKTYKENFLKRFQLTKLPPYLIFCIKRFTKNNFFVEKNPTIVNFPITNVDLREYLSEEVQAVHKNTTYDLIANIVHDGKPAEGAYRIHVLHHGTGKWYELQDLQVTDILPQMITLSEAYIQIWKRRDNEEETNQQGA